MTRADGEPGDGERPYILYGVEASPYTVKLRAALRYRRLPYRWVCRSVRMYEPLAHVRPQLMPVLRFPDGGLRTDSTPILEELEERHGACRSLLPERPRDRFLARLIEDMADEWLTKCLFFYRFNTPEDGEFAARWVMDDAQEDLSAEQYAAAVAPFVERQMGRMGLVGATPDAAPLLEASYLRILDALEGTVANGRFLFGTRPSVADLALFGQLKTLGIDPTPMAVMRARAPRTDAWVRRADDLSGVEGEWEEPGPAVAALLGMAREIYWPFLKANAAGDVDVMLAGHRFRQPQFRYQAKCYDRLAKLHAALAPGEREEIGLE